ncbi:double homeobox protein A-like [Oryctolagus cuniculus]|uniref:double homeobox protein A-like n=1 Tax=Oryctolagus cuniculus TaxID=9986 RepID=UPI0004919AEA|nr:double homeobox protein A-like [Oryctolagus cuniculus]
MAEDNCSHKKLSKNHRCSPTKFTKEQLKILINAFNQKTYPGYPSKQKLALDINTKDSRIQVWFQNPRAQYPFQKRPELEEALDSSQGHGEDCPQEQIQNLFTVQTESRQCHSNYSSSRSHTLIKAFLNNSYPGIDSREQLAKEIRVPESRTQIWFQRQRNRFLIQRKQKSNEPLEEDQGEEDRECFKSFKKSRNLPFP